MQAANQNLPAAWTTRDGSVMLIREMPATHLLNALASLSQYRAESDPKLAALLAEAHRRGLRLPAIQRKSV